MTAPVIRPGEEHLGFFSFLKVTFEYNNLCSGPRFADLRRSIGLKPS